MAIGASGRQRGAVADINVTPLVDVMLVLLVIFMVTTPMMQQGMDVNLPRAESRPLTQVEDALVVSVGNSGRVFVSREEVPAGELASRVTTLLATRSAKEVFLRADDGVPYGTVVRTLADLRGAGIERLGMVTQPPRDE